MDVSTPPSLDLACPQAKAEIEKSSRRFYSVWTPFGIPFLQNTEIGKKTETGTGPSVNRLVPKII